MNLEKAIRIWGEEWCYAIAIIDEAIRQLNLSKDSKILDVGTGQGIMAVSLAHDGFNVLTREPEEGSVKLINIMSKRWGILSVITSMKDTRDSTL